MTTPFNPVKPVFRRAPPRGLGIANSNAINVANVTAAGVNVPKNQQRINKRMAELGMCSRREADAWVEQGWIKVNGILATIGQQVVPFDVIEIDRVAKGQQANLVTILFNKPMGYVSAQAEDGHLPAVNLFTPENRWVEDNARFFWHHSQMVGLAPAGRLDIDSVGLLVMTQDGRVARQLIGNDSEMEKEYLVRVEYHADGLFQTTRVIAIDVDRVFPLQSLAKLRFGLSLDGELLKRAVVEWQNPEQLRFVLTQGKKRQIRRMCEQVGLKVVGLKRVRMGQVVLGNLPTGKWRYLAPHERF